MSGNKHKKTDHKEEDGDEVSAVSKSASTEEKELEGIQKLQSTLMIMTMANTDCGQE